MTLDHRADHDAPPRPPRERRDHTDRPARWELAAVALVVAAFLAVGGAMIIRGEPLGHDEAVYAMQARNYAGIFAEGGYWAEYRAPGLPALISIGLRVRDGDLMARGVPLLLGAGVVLLTWLYARRLIGPRGGVVAAALLASTPGFLRWSWQIGVDVPGAFFGLAAILAFLSASRGERVSRWAYLSIPLALAAAYTRFGAPILVASGMTAVALAHWRAVRASLRRTALVAAGTAGAMVAVLYLPFMTGSPIAPAYAFGDRQVAKGLSAWQSYSDFARATPTLLGPVVGPLTAIGIVLIIGAVLTRRVNARGPLVALGTLVVFFIGLNYGLAQGFEQYLTPGVPFLATAAAAGLTQVRPPKLASLMVVGVLTAGALGWSAASSSETADALEKRFRALRSGAVRAGAAVEHPCVVLTSYMPQVSWYSRCAGFKLLGHSESDEEPTTMAEARALLATVPALYRGAVPDDAPIIFMMVKDGKRQPRDVMLEAYLETSQERLVTVGKPRYGRLRYITVDRLRL